MSVDQRSSDPEEPADESQLQKLVDSVRRRDPNEFNKLVRHLEYPLVAYLYPKCGLTWEQSCELVNDTIKAACTSLRTGRTPTDLQPSLFDIANDHLGDQHAGKEVLVPDTDFNPVPDRRALYTFVEADTDLERQQVVRRNLPVFLELMHNAVDGMPATLRAVIGTLAALTECHAVDLDQRSDTIDTLVRRLDLDHAETSRVNEALETLLQVTAALLTARTSQTKQKTDVIALVGGLPAVVLLLVVRLDDRRQQLVEAAFGTEIPQGTASGAAGVESHSATPLPAGAEPLAQGVTLWTTRLTQLPLVRPAIEAIQQHPYLMQYGARGPAAVIAAVTVAAGLVIGVVTIGGGPSDATPPSIVNAAPATSAGSAPSDSVEDPPLLGGPTPGSTPSGATGPVVPTTSSGGSGSSDGGSDQVEPRDSRSTGRGGTQVGPGGDGTQLGPDVGGNPDRAALGSPAWGYASTREYQYEEAVGTEIDLHRQWQWGTWRRSSDPVLAGRYATMTRTGTGRYVVRMPGLGPVAGIAHAELSAGWGYPQATACQVARAWRDGADQMVEVACFDPAGAPKNLPFLVSYIGASKGPTPMLAARYDGADAESATGSTVTVSRTSAGRYTLTSGGAFNGRGFARITPVGATPARCRPAEIAATNGGLRIRVECDGPGGAALNTGWTLSYTERVGMHHDSSVPAAYLATTGDPANPAIAPDRTWSSNGETPTVAHQPQVGVYRVYYQQIGKPAIYPADAVAVTAIGPEARFCRNQVWNSYSFPRKVTIEVFCFNATGQPADATFALAYLRAP